jgi:hypothetical protein
MTKSAGRLLYWTPRILSILFIVFLALFSLDVIQPGMGIGQILLGLFMHNIPVLVMVVLLIIAWKYEIVGAVTFIIFGLAYLGLSIYRIANSDMFWLAGLISGLVISGPALLTGVLFLIGWRKKKVRTAQ